jgi:hypothetical protein
MHVVASSSLETLSSALLFLSTENIKQLQSGSSFFISPFVYLGHFRCHRLPLACFLSGSESVHGGTVRQ